MDKEEKKKEKEKEEETHLSRNHSPQLGVLRVRVPGSSTPCLSTHQHTWAPV